jgi:putative transposase
MKTTLTEKCHGLCRAVDQEGAILDIWGQCRRDKPTAKTVFRQLLKGLKDVPRVVVTDKLKNDNAAKRELLPGGEHRQHRDLNIRAENPHQPTRQRERRIQGFKSPGQAQRFVAVYDPIVPYYLAAHHEPSYGRIRLTTMAVMGVPAR